MLNRWLHVTYETSASRRLLAGSLGFLKYRVLRPLVSMVAYLMWSRSRHRERLTSRDGRPLQPGVAFCLVARNEAETIDACLDSLRSIADQVVAIDNGSTDATPQCLERFEKETSGQLDVLVLKRPGITLARARQEAADRVNRAWFFRADADMVFLEEFVARVRPLLAARRPGAIQCGRANFFGDYYHYSRVTGPVSKGEYYLRRFDRDVAYVEYEDRLEHARIPLHYRLIQPRALAMLHVDSNKPNERLLLRTCYLDWRQETNRGTAAEVSFETYRRRWLAHNFGVADGLSLRYRMARLVAALCVRHENKEWIARAERLASRYPCHHTVLYVDGRPHLRLDRRDTELVDYEPGEADRAWHPEVSRFHTDSIRTAVPGT